MTSPITRREMLRSSVALAALAMTQMPLRSFGFAEPDARGVLIPFLDQQPPGRKQLRWEQLKNWITPNEEVFAVSHYGIPTAEQRTDQVEISGLVRKPRTWTLEQIKARKRRTVTATLECSGNSSSTGFMGAIGNVRWTGTPLISLLEESEPLKRGSEVVFFGADQKVEKIREKDYLQNFARSLSMAEARREDILVAYEMNGEPLTVDHGAPLRLIVPGWFGIAWVKWLKRIEVLDRRYMSKYMAREYVTLRGEERDGETVWRETSVGPIDVKSICARAERLKNGNVRFTGAAWTDGAPLKKVEIRIDDGPWESVELDRKNRAPYAWRFWTYEWRGVTSGEHKVVSRAIDAEGRMQPAAEDPAIQLKKTYWEANQQHVRRIRITEQSTE